MSSCIPQRKLKYLQDFDETKDYQNPYTPADTIIQNYMLRPNDYLYIRVITSDERLSQFFNKTGTQGGGNIVGAGGQGGAKLLAYQIDDFMHIDLPFVGEIDLSECNLKMARDTIRESLSGFLDEFALIVELMNSYIIMLGEVNSPGRHSLNEDVITIFDAVAMAGDMTQYARRKEVRIIRPTETGSIMYTVDLLDKNILESEGYYIYPNDMIYVEPVWVKMFAIGETFSWALIFSTISLVLIMTQLVK